MCGRYALVVEHELLRIKYGFNQTEPISARYNIAPTQSNPTVIGSDASSQLGTGARELRFMRWGLIPHWAKDPTIGNKLINARAETVHEKPSFRDAFKKRRCLVPATGYFEWMQRPGELGKRPMYIFLPDAEIFSMAGLWSQWKSPDGQEIESYTILTTDPNGFMKRIHNRMPAILNKADEEMWLDDSVVNPADLQSLLRPFESQPMDAYEVSKVVNSPKNDSPECIRKVA